MSEQPNLLDQLRVRYSPPGDLLFFFFLLGIATSEVKYNGESTASGRSSGVPLVFLLGSFYCTDRSRSDRPSALRRSRNRCASLLIVEALSRLDPQAPGWREGR
jgi:hypothetical protein